MDPNVLRSRFLDFFAQQDHTLVASSPVVPKKDPTLLFANAGMNQFKEVFLGNEVRDYKRAASSQKCIRAGGKHNDLDEVGKDGRHLTFFEMLGNWSFGDYYKRESITWGWQFLTEVLEIAPEQLFVTTYKDDDEAWAIWRDEVGVPEARMMRLGDIEKGDEENFWSMGPIGPCGPCTEIHFDTMPEKGEGWGPGYDEERYVEIWNHVFMEYDRDEDGTLTPLPLRSVDTGMGLERVAALLSGKASVYETSIFEKVLVRTASLLGKTMTQEEVLASEEAVAYQVIADHIRSLTFAVSEGQPFSNEGRGYVLRRILRRALRFGRKLGFDKPFLHQLAEAVAETFADVYPELMTVTHQTQDVIRYEEERFLRTLDRGLARFEEVVERSKAKTISGADAFMLYDTFGFPLDLTEIMAEERQMVVDKAGFDVALAEQRERSSGASRFALDDAGPWNVLHEKGGATFVGYARSATASRIVRYRSHGDQIEVLLDMTPFYAESGGQVGDKGTITAEDGTLRFKVVDTQKSDVGIVHICELEEGFLTEEAMRKDVIAEVNAELRGLTACNHTATHLLHAALHEVVSADAFQAGSLVRHDKLRFDFSLPRALTDDEIAALEDWVNEQIRAGYEVKQHVDVPVDTAKEWGAAAIFGEKYGNRVRVIEVPKVSMELCGGIHVANTRDILSFKILQEGAIAAGTRRIEAVTNAAALAETKREHGYLMAATQAAKVDHPKQLEERILKLQAEVSELEKARESLVARLAQAETQAILAEGREIGGVKVYASRVKVSDRKALLVYADMLRDKMGEGVALLGAAIDGKPALLCMVSKALVGSHKLKAGELVNAAAAMVGGRGGGRPTLAQAGGQDLSKLDAAIHSVYKELETRLS